MKYFFLYFILISSVCSGQIGIQVGMNAASLSVTDGIFSSETSARLGWHAGIQYRTQISKDFLFSPAVLYSKKGAGFGSFVPTLELDYLEIPILFIFQRDPEYGFFAEAGPFIALLMSAMDGNFDVKENYNNTDLGIILGAGYDLGNIILGGRGGLGLVNIPTTNPGTTQEVRTSTINGQLYIALQL